LVYPATDGDVQECYDSVSGKGGDRNKKDFAPVDGIWPESTLAFGQNSGLTEMIISRNLIVGKSKQNSAGRIGIGDPDSIVNPTNRYAIHDPNDPDPGNDWKLPAGIDITVGVGPNDRGTVKIGEENPSWAWNKVQGYFTADTGGDFTAFLNDLTITRTDRRGPRVGLFDISRMDSCDINTLSINLTIGTADGNRHWIYYPYGLAVMKLPSGNVATNTLAMGTYGQAYLHLNDTTVTVNTSAVIGGVANYYAHREGTVIVDLTGDSAGLDLAENATLELGAGGITNRQGDGPQDGAGGKIIINFLEPPSANPGRYYGLRWKGTVADTKDVLDAYEAAGRIIVTINQAVYNELGPDATYAITHDGEYAYVELAVVEPERSVYGFSFDGAESVGVGEDTAMEVTFASVEVKDAGYPLVRITFEADGPGEVTFTSGEYSTVNEGVWLGGDFELPATYTDTLDWTLSFSKCGSYTITFTCFQVDELGEPLEDGLVAEGSAVVDALLYADVNRDCVVNLLDLVFVRNRLFSDLENPDNAPANINGDELIDLEDLIEVRNNLGAQ